MKSIDIKDLDKLALDYPYLFLPYLFKFLQGKNIYSLLISLVLAHVVAITHWQLLQKTVSSTGKLIVEH